MKTLDRSQVIAHLRELIDKSDPNSELFENPNRHAKFVQQMERLVRLLEEENTATPTLAQISDFVFPGLKDSSRRTAFASFRTLLSKVATEIGYAFECIQPDQRGRDKHEIQCRFEGRPLPIEPDIRNATKRATAGIDRIDHLLANPPFAAMKSSDLEKVVKGQLPRDEKGRIPIKFFVSYTRKDGDTVNRLLKKLRYDLDASKKYSFEFWKDTRIPLGEDWHDEIQNALEQCDIGLALVSPGFISSDYITAEELPVLVSGKKPLIPIAVKPIDFDRHNLHGLEAKQIFRLEEGGKFRAFSECRQGVVERYIQALARKVEERAEASVKLRTEALLMEAMGDPSKVEILLGRFPKLRENVDRPSESSRKRITENSATDAALRSVSQRVSAKFPIDDRIKPTVGAGCLEEVTKLIGNSRARDQDANPYERFRDHRRLAIDYLRDWLRDPDSAPFAAVLGEVGSGKTTMLQLLTKEVEKDPEEPPVIFIDLRDYQGTKELTLEKILSEYLRRYDPDRKLTGDAILEAVRKQNALVIFDGLDEKIISMSEGERHGFIRELWRILPVEVMDRSVEEGRGRMIISCRSHYFPTIQSLNSGYVAQDRQGVKTQDYVACVMLPWETEQVEEYLRLALGDEHVEGALETIASVHNLTDLSQRPYLLNLIAPELESLQLEQAAGRSVNAAALYEKFIERWLRRDEGKHVFTVEHKRLLMEQLAADLWRDGAREWPWEQVAEWLDQFLYDHPVIANRYQRDGATTAMLAQDFRTATFFLRPDASDDGFRFAHTSLQEFFLAGHLLRGFERGVEEGTAAWDLPEPSLETFVFLGQMVERLSERKRNSTFGNFAMMMGNAKASAEGRRNGLAAYFIACEDDFPVPHMEKIAANDLDLDGIELGFDGSKPIDLPTIDFSRSSMIGSELQNVNFSPHTTWEGVDLRSARLIRCNFSGTEIEAAFIDGSFYRDCDVSKDLRNYGEGIRVQSSAEKPQYAKYEAQFQVGHNDLITKVCSCPRGNIFVSASNDHSIKVWNSSSGECLQTLIGHTDRVTELKLSADGKTLISGSSDRTIRRWSVLKKNNSEIIISADESITCMETVREPSAIIWAARDGSLVMQGLAGSDILWSIKARSTWHESISISPREKLLAAGEFTGRIEVWDLQARNLKYVCDVEDDPLKSVAFSRDSCWLVSSSLSGRIRVWDAETGYMAQNFNGFTPFHNAEGKMLFLSRSSDSHFFEVRRIPDGRLAYCIAADDSMLGLHSISTCGKYSIWGDLNLWVKAWESESLTQLRKISYNHCSLSTHAVSPDGKLVAIGAADGVVRLLDAESGHCKRRLLGHRSSITDVSFSPDSKSIVSSGLDQTVRLWSVSVGRQIEVFSGIENQPEKICFTRDGKSLMGIDFMADPVYFGLCGDQAIPKHSFDVLNISQNHDELRAEQLGVLAVCSEWVERRQNGRLRFRFLPVPFGNSVLLHPWNDDEARKPSHECRWKLVSGPEDAWRYISAFDRETGESFGPEYCTDNGTWEIT